MTMYIVLGGRLTRASFTRSTMPLTLPSADFGALLALTLGPASGLDIIGVIGIVLLIGIVVKNAIMMIDFALEALEDRRD